MIVPDFDRLRAWAREAGISADDDKQLVADPRVRRQIKSEIDRLSTELAAG